DRGVHRSDGAIVNLFEVSFALTNLRRIDVEWNHILGEAKWVQTSIGLVNFSLDVVQGRSDVAKLGDGRAVDLLDSSVGGIRVCVGQQSIGGNPIEVSSLPRATGPLGQPPSAIGVCVLIALPLSGRVFHVGTAIGQVHDFG